MKLNRRQSRNQAHFQARLEAQRNALRSDMESVKEFPSPPKLGNSLFKSDVPSPYKSVDELILAGNRKFENLDKVDFAGFRNNKTLGQKTLQDVTQQVTEFHADRTTQAYRDDISRVLNARYLQGHGVQVQEHLDASEMRSLRKYLQRESSTYNVADSVRSINTSLSDGEQRVERLKLEAEKYLFTERGLDGQQFDERFAQLPLKELSKIRDFSDAWSASQGGKFLPLSHGTNFNEHRDSMAREMLAQAGYEHVNSIDLDTVLSLLRDIDSEGPRTNAALRESVNENLARGVKDYFILNTLANEEILKDIGLPDSEMSSLEVSDELLKERYPKLEPREARAIRTRVLRDLLRAQPPSERGLAQKQLGEADANLVTSEKVLANHFRSRVADLTEGQIDTKGMGAMQLSNLSSAVSKLPKDVRKAVFSGPNAELNDRLEKIVESQFGIRVHREAGVAPDKNKDVAPFVKDWTPQGLVDLYNAMSGMAKNGKLPETLVGNSTIAYVEGSGPSKSMLVGPQSLASDPVGPWNRPGAYAHASGKSAYYGMCSPDATGHDTVYFCDDALLGANGDSAESVTIGESTIIHEFGHAIQLGGTPNAPKEQRESEQQVLMAEWSALSQWKEPGEILADGRMGSFEYYYDPTVQVDERQEVATTYGASDPCEDFAEYVPYFYKAPDVAMELSAEKFLYLNQMVGDHYSENQIKKVARKLGIGGKELREHQRSMELKVAAAPDGAGLKVG